jgi:rhamnogalacturonan endolyase
LLITWVSSAIANIPGGGNEGDDATATMSGNDVVLTNGIVTATVDPSSATILSLRYQGHEMISQTGRHQDLYFFLDGDKGYQRFSNCVLSIKQPTSDIVDVGCNMTYDPANSKMHACDVNTHFVLGRGMTGIYVYTILNHPATYPALNVGQYLMI